MLQLNTELSRRALQQQPETQFDLEKGEVVIKFKDGHETRMAVPGFKPGMTLGMVSLAHGSCFIAGSTHGVPAEEEQEYRLRVELERTLERFYGEAFRVQKAAEKLGKKFPYTGVTIVRNHLLEHPKERTPP